MRVFASLHDLGKALGLPQTHLNIKNPENLINIFKLLFKHSQDYEGFQPFKPFKDLKLLTYLSGCPLRILEIVEVANGLEKPRCLPQTI